MPRDTERSGRLRAALLERKLDGIVCGLPANVLLLSGYWPVVGTSLAIATRDGALTVIAPDDEERLARAGTADEVVTFKPGSLEKIQTATEAVREVFRAAFKRLGLDSGVVGCDGGEMFEPSSYAGMHLYGARLYELLAESFTSGSPAAADSMLSRIRAVKTPTELDRLRRSCRIAGEAYHQGTPQLAPGMRESDAAVRFESVLSTVGIGYESVERAGGHVACMSGANSGRAFGSYARSRAKQIAGGDLVLTHCNSFADGYWTDITRTFSMGPPGERATRMYEAVFAARAAALSAIRPGARAADVDRAARNVVNERGFKGRLRHPTGHGVGFAAIDHNAYPRIHPASTDILETGMTFNIEPGIYFEDWGGMRHCDMVAVTADGAEVLTPFLCGMEAMVRA